MTHTLSRAEALAALGGVGGGQALYDDLRPAYTRLEPLVVLLRRRGFSGVMHAVGQQGEGALWFARGQLLCAWLFPPGASRAEVHQHNPLEVLRTLWTDADAVVMVRPGEPPRLPEAAAGSASQDHVAPSAISQTLPAAHTPADPALAGIPWERLLPEALARVRRHRGGPLAQQLEDAINEALTPTAILAGAEVRGAVEPGKGAAALRGLAAGLGRVAGGAFADRLIWTLGRDFDCEEAVKTVVRLEPAP